MAIQRNPPPLSSFLAPRHWPMWLGLGLLRLLSLLPFSVLVKLGGRLGSLLYRRLRTRRYVTLANLRLCLPELDEAARERLAEASFQALGIAIFESALAWWGSDRRLERLVRVEGIEHYQSAQAQGRGVILLGGHYSTLEISGRLAGFHIGGFYPVYKNALNPLFNALMKRARARRYAGILNSHDMRAIVRTLKAGKTIWYAPDQDFGRESSIFAPFFGVPTATLLMTLRLARLSGAPVVPAFSERLPGAQGYRLTFLTALENFPSGDDLRDATLINATMEAEIRRNPEQYLWAHRRFKSRPEGEPPIYER